jgi:hypothetical protein
MEDIVILRDVVDLVNSKIKTITLYDSAVTLSKCISLCTPETYDIDPDVIYSSNYYTNKIHATICMLDFIYYIHQDPIYKTTSSFSASDAHFANEKNMSNARVIYHCHRHLFFEPRQDRPVEIACLSTLYELLEFIGNDNLDELSTLMFSHDDTSFSIMAFQHFIDNIYQEANPERQQLLPQPTMLNILRYKLDLYKEDIQMTKIGSSFIQSDHTATDTDITTASSEAASRPRTPMSR